MNGTPVEFTRLPITIPCAVPVVPGTPDIDAPLEQRTEKCSVDAGQMMGLVPICDIHLKEVCELVDGSMGSAESIVKALGRQGDFKTPWAERHRYDQDEATSWQDGLRESFARLEQRG